VSDLACDAFTPTVERPVFKVAQPTALTDSVHSSVR